MILSLLLVLTAQASASFSTYNECQNRVLAGNYGSANWQYTCEDNFDMADPYLVKCLRMVKDGFPTPADKAGCKQFCVTNNNLGPWDDFEMPFALKDLLANVRTLHKQGKCLE